MQPFAKFLQSCLHAWSIAVHSLPQHNLPKGLDQAPEMTARHQLTLLNHGCTSAIGRWAIKVVIENKEDAQEAEIGLGHLSCIND